YKGLNLEMASNETLERLTEIGGEGGFIAVDGQGNLVLPFNSEGMYRGWQDVERGPRVEIYKS
ncbi:MAG TPA: isoaspartyl peptidase/L-asparaginase, partial [Pyrinomonadaceae bacterium]|nr:isoaspartyl peptidase/L-asparaginase [Pyrinomonadaceae bacterium]